MELLPTLTRRPASEFVNAQERDYSDRGAVNSTANAGPGSLAVRVEQAIRATGYPALRNVEVCERQAVVVLAGPVPTYYLKQVAQAASLTVAGVGHVQNDLEVITLR
jgi:osmotically-inducible protein OsmY